MKNSGIKSRIVSSTGISLMLLIMLINPTFVGAVERVMVTTGTVLPGEVTMKAFTLSKDGRVKVESAFGLFLENGSELIFYGWILDSNTRKVVWQMLKEDSEFARGVSNINDVILLPKGDYEIYYTAAWNHEEELEESHNMVSRIFSGIFKLDKKKYMNTYRDQLKITVSGPSEYFNEANTIDLLNRWEKNAVVSIVRALHESRIRKVFLLKKETRVHIYALGESHYLENRHHTTYDYAWIDDIENNKRTWSMDERDIKHAGGANKNIFIDEEITLPAGKYMVYYTTDGSHSFENWNSLPPNDPQAWGITIRPVNQNELANAVPIQDFQFPKPVLELTKINEDKKVSLQMILDKPMKLRIFCLGEGDVRGKMVDYGWIDKAGTGEKIWTMSGKKNRHAGGAQKNRMLNEIIQFDKGNYVVNYVTDDSHAYNKWNSAAPFDPERWGITIWVTDENDRKHVQVIK